MLIDSHCHLNSLSQSIRDELVSSGSSNHYYIDSSIDIVSSKSSLSLSREHDFIYTSLGFHPLSAGGYTSGTINEYRQLINQHQGIVAIGEIGLDYKAEIPFDRQEEIFRDFIALAKDTDLTVVLHNRFDPSLKERNRFLEESFKRVFDILNENYPTYEGVVFHCFSYSKEILSAIVRKGGYISFSLNILRNKEAILSSLRACPLENLLLETDSPYMRIGGRASTPLDIKQTYLKASIIKGVEAEALEEAVYANVKKAFKVNLKG